MIVDLSLGFLDPKHDPVVHPAHLAPRWVRLPNKHMLSFVRVRVRVRREGSDLREKEEEIIWEWQLVSGKPTKPSASLTSKPQESWRPWPRL